MIRAVALLVVTLLLPLAARAHEVLHTVDRGHAVAVKAYFADGEVLAYVPYELWSPADTKIPYQKGRTDRGGAVAFLPTVPGPWHLRIADDTGHGLDTTVEVAPPGKGAAQESPQTLPTLAFVLRPVVGVLVIGIVFALLLWHYRRKREPR